MESLIYRPAELPLEAFFRRLAKGDFEKALRSIRLRYEPSSHDGKAMKAIISAGFVPVLVRARNAGPTAAGVEPAALTLKSPEGDLSAIPEGDLPRELESVHWPSVAANMYNTTVVVVGYAAVLAAVAVTAYYSGAALPAELASLHPAEVRVWNPVKKVLDLDYRDFLYRGGPLQPGETRQGLLFFRLRGKDRGGLILRAAPR